MEKKLKHLEFIQAVITRMNANSFLLKGWTVTIVAALFALAAKDANYEYGYISLFVIAVFWVLDGFFLSNERCYRALYEAVRIKGEDAIDFDMNATTYKSIKRNQWLFGIFSKTLVPFYLVLIVIVIIALKILATYTVNLSHC